MRPTAPPALSEDNNENNKTLFQTVVMSTSKQAFRAHRPAAARFKTQQQHQGQRTSARTTTRNLAQRSPNCASTRLGQGCTERAKGAVPQA